MLMPVVVTLCYLCTKPTSPDSGDSYHAQLGSVRCQQLPTRKPVTTQSLGNLSSTTSNAVMNPPFETCSCLFFCHPMTSGKETASENNLSGHNNII